MSEVLSFQKDLLLSGLAGGSLVTSAVISMNVGLPMPLSMGLFTAGWFLLIKSFKDQMNRDSYTNDAMTKASILVWLSAISLRLMMDSGVKGVPMMLGGMLFMGGWLAIGSKVTSRTSPDSLSPLYGLTTPMLVFLSMASINGFERPNAVASGPGIFMFSTAWVVLALLNSFDNNNSFFSV